MTKLCTVPKIKKNEDDDGIDDLDKCKVGQSPQQHDVQVALSSANSR